MKSELFVEQIKVHVVVFKMTKSTMNKLWT